jgi:hypothetical protein
MGDNRLYTSCGVAIQSDIELPELFESDSNDSFAIRIKQAEVPSDSLSHATIIKPYSRFTKEVYFLEVPNVIRLLVQEGAEIQVQFLTADIHFAAQFIYSNAIPVAMLQRKMVLFQASGVLDHEGHAWLFFASPRSGRTSLGLMLHERGYRFFEDKAVYLNFNHDQVVATSFSPSIHIWKPVVSVQKSFNESDLKPVRQGIPKFTARLTEGYLSEPVPVRGLLNVENLSASMRHGPIKPIDAFEVLRNSVWFNHMTSDLGMEASIMKLLATLIKQSTLIQLDRPKIGESYHELAEYVDKGIISGGSHG